MAIVLDGTTGIISPAIDVATPISAADLGSGTADSTTFLRGDQTWQTISVTPSTADVLNATAGAAAGDVGTYAFLGDTTANVTVTVGTTRAGSSLRYAGVGINSQNWPTWANLSTSGSSLATPRTAGGTPAGTWRCMGHHVSAQISLCTTFYGAPATLWLRIS